MHNFRKVTGAKVFREHVSQMTSSNQQSITASNPDPKEQSLKGIKLKSVREIKGFKDYPLLGTVPSVFLHKKFDTKSIHELWRAAFHEYGPIVKLRYPWSVPVIIIYRPEDVETAFRLTESNPIRFGLSSLRKVRHISKEKDNGETLGILSDNNENWRKVRSKVQPPTMKLQNLYKYLPMVDEVALDFVERIQDLQNKYGEMPPDFLEEIYKWGIESISVVTLNRRFGCLEANAGQNTTAQKLIHTISTTFNLLSETEVKVKFWRYFPTPTFRKLQKNQDEFKNLIEEALKEGEFLPNSKKPHDEMSFLDIVNSTKLNKSDVLTFLVDLYIGGVDTTSHTLAFALYSLARNPKVQARLQEEIDEVLGDDSTSFNESHHAKFSYLKSVVKETLRLYPIVVGVARLLEKDAVLSGYLIPKGHAVLCANMVTSRHDEVFPRANEFIPERWRRDRPLGPIHPFASTPFSQGSRMCIGRRIAENELYVILARIMQRFNVQYNYEDFDLRIRFVAMPSQPLRFKFTERKK